MKNKTRTDQELLHEVINAALSYYLETYRRQFQQSIKISNIQLEIEIFAKTVLLTLEEGGREYFEQNIKEAIQNTHQVIKNIYLEPLKENPSMGKLKGYFPTDKKEKEVSLLYCNRFYQLYDYAASEKETFSQDCTVSVPMMEYFNQCCWLYHYEVFEDSEKEWFGILMLDSLYYARLFTDSESIEFQEFKSVFQEKMKHYLGASLPKEKQKQEIFLYNEVCSMIKKHAQVFGDDTGDKKYFRENGVLDRAEEYRIIIKTFL